MNRAKVSVIKVKLCNALLRILLVSISTCLNSVLRYNFFFNFGHLSSGHNTDVSKDVGILGYFSKPKRGT